MFSRVNFLTERAMDFVTLQIVTIIVTTVNCHALYIEPVYSNVQTLYQIPIPNPSPAPPIEYGPPTDLLPPVYDGPSVNIPNLPQPSNEYEAPEAPSVELEAPQLSFSEYSQPPLFPGPLPEPSPEYDVPPVFQQSNIPIQQVHEYLSPPLPDLPFQAPPAIEYKASPVPSTQYDTPRDIFNRFESSSVLNHVPSMQYETLPALPLSAPIKPAEDFVPSRNIRNNYYDYNRPYATIHSVKPVLEYGTAPIFTSSIPFKSIMKYVPKVLSYLIGKPYIKYGKGPSFGINAPRQVAIGYGAPQVNPSYYGLPRESYGPPRPVTVPQESYGVPTI